MHIQKNEAPSLTNSPSKPLAVSVKEMCRLLDIGNTKAWELIGSGRVESFAIGRKRLVVYSTIEKLLAQTITT